MVGGPAEPQDDWAEGNGTPSGESMHVGKPKGQVESHLRSSLCLVLESPERFLFLHQEDEVLALNHPSGLLGDSLRLLIRTADTCCFHANGMGCTRPAPTSRPSGGPGARPPLHTSSRGERASSSFVVCVSLEEGGVLLLCFYSLKMMTLPCKSGWQWGSSYSRNATRDRSS